MNQKKKKSTSRTLTPEEELARKIVPKLASRSYHLPGYGLWRDYFQYLFNNHPVLGICCHHKLHPLKFRQRLLILLGSFAFGVAITNAIYLWFLGSGRDDQEQVFSVTLNDSQKYSLSSGLLALVTIGSGSHAIFDRSVWGLSACACCNAGGRFEGWRCTSLGHILVSFLVLIVVAFASCIVVVRASMEEGESDVPLLSSQNRTRESIEEELSQIASQFMEFDAQDYSFMRGYAYEFAFSLFFYYPIIETILFSGMLGCFRIPILGGRPAAMKKEAKQKATVTASEVRNGASLA